MKLNLFLNKSIEENAEVYFEKAKKARKKLEGVEKAIEITKKKLEKEEALKEIKEKERKEKEEAKKLLKAKRKKFWFEKFRWFITSEGNFVIGGKDATSNEILIKKHTNKEDLVFHTDLAGSPFCILKHNKSRENNPDNKPSEEFSGKEKEEVAIFTASFSRAWAQQLSFLEVFYVKPEQVSKKARAGEYLGKGAFMILGKTNYIGAKLGLSIGTITKEISINIDNNFIPMKGMLMVGPLSAVKTYCEKHVELSPGKLKKSDSAKKIKSSLSLKESIDEILQLIPTGGCSITSNR